MVGEHLMLPLMLLQLASHKRRRVCHSYLSMAKTLGKEHASTHCQYWYMERLQWLSSFLLSGKLAHLAAHCW